MANQTWRNRTYGQGQVDNLGLERALDFAGSAAYYAVVKAIIPYDSSLAELFTLANPGYVIGGANPGVNIGSVAVLSIAAGETHVGQVGGEGIAVSQTPTVTAGAYSANDAVGGLLTFASAARVSGGKSFLKNVLMIDDAGQDAELELWLFDRTFTAMADNDAWAPSEADLRNLLAIVSTSDGAWFAAGTPSVARIEVTQQLVLNGTSLFGQLVTRGTPTFAATDDVTVKIALMQD